ncbi:MAG: glutamate synthase subunit beta [Bacilli bacterium]
MGKINGFLEYDRRDKKEIDPKERVKNFSSFHIPFTEEEQKEQAARCMNCGIPFCQSALKVNNKNVGCPLSNLIPEWNHLIYLGLFEEAYKRLALTAPFPEFTGHVCPAICEECCTNSIDSKAVGIKANELFLIEKAFENGWIKPKLNIKRNGVKVAVIGSGPAGLACAKMLNDNGFSVTVYEKNDRFGGLLMYGIPQMKIEKHIIERRINLLQEEGIKFINNTYIGKDITLEELSSIYDEIVFSCGTSLPRPLNVKNNHINGIVYAVDFLTQITKDLLDKKDFFYNLDGKHVVVVGGGDTGNDCCGSAVRLKAKSITELEITPCPPSENTLPWPNYSNKRKIDYGVKEANEYMGHDIVRYKTTIDEIVGEDHIEGIYVKQVEFTKDGLVDIPNTRVYLPCDLLIISMGFLGTSDEDLSLYHMEGKNHRINLNGYKYKNNISVCGDMKNGQSLVVLAEKDGQECAKTIINKYQN